MRLSSIPALTCAIQLASAAIGSIYTYDPQAPSRQNDASNQQKLSPSTARLVLAQRAGVEEYHSSDALDKDAIAAINAYGTSTPLFGQKESLKKAFVLLEGAESAETHMPLLYSYRAFEVDISRLASSTPLFIDLAKQSDPAGLSALSDDDTLALLRDSRTTTRNGDIFYVAKSLEDFKALFTALMESKSRVITAMVMPYSSVGGLLGDLVHPWGTYEMPGSQSPLRKRKEPQEDPLIEEEGASSTFAPVRATSMSVSSLADQTPLQGILPACYTSESACMSATRNCTGHGSCYKKYHDPDMKEGGVDCYACGCKATVTKNDEGQVKTTYWGGPACQKKDVSMAFWLIALFTVGLVYLISFAVGTLYSMGSEDLPSVIGAGVSGPVRK